MSFGPNIFFANQIAGTFNIEYLQNGFISRMAIV